MRRFEFVRRVWLPLVPWLCISSAIAWADTNSEPVTQVAGRTLEQHSVDLDSPDRTVRLRALRSLLPFGAAASDAISGCLAHDDAAMRFVAAVSLGDLGRTAVTPLKSKLVAMCKDDESLAVRTAAAYALCQIDESSLSAHLPILIEGLDYPERGMACSSAELIGKLGPKARDMATLPLTAAFESNKPGSPGDYHIGGAAKNALRKLGAIE